ncbi:protein-methionine-sulfoxide reductase heme-binding subunit MsrQ [Cereibacter sphaeroides]|uniref:protein-methionine-sulfoxide reductase heme-binding subunit MsrQ n=1 Tax=Cereibacter sphaeroides TaxID=1063 RepID=UPI001F1B3D36|nr:protein-methionine-sulfoxide reductase heme-binding subunit MsrQ [Cereibacter sphaeroides]MCE6952157.1 protein-methionine-sulfoxide reductase heme-binding subunit MsrQ [Cereibacter sphaeroides]MCE6969554.1 protein-methionine-sulfoxide reductase heme-binding subunit MsrQ [Cereibacter sphaeroides]
MVAQRINGALRPVPSAAVYAAGLVPLVLLVVQAATGALGVDPVKEIEHRLGELALQFLVAGLVISPLRWWTGVNLIRFRRAIGLLAFFYVCLHLAVWLALDLQFRWAEIGADIAKRPYITLGMAGFVAMIPLALTSNNASIRRLGAAAWGRLHRLTYLVAVLGVLHFLLLVKAWPVEPMLYVAAVAALLALRMFRSLRRAG